MRVAASIMCLLVLAGCQPSLEGPSLKKRPAESIDPRVPVGSPQPPPGPLTIADRLTAAERQLLEGERAFERQLGPTQSRVSAAGPRGSESWVVALESLAMLERAHGDVATALADLDRLITDQIDEDGWASPTDRAAADRLLDDARAIAVDQRTRIAALSARLAR